MQELPVFETFRQAVFVGNLVEVNRQLALVIHETVFTETEWSDLIFAAKQSIEQATAISSQAKKNNIDIFLGLLKKLVEISAPKTGFCLSEAAHHVCLDVLEQHFTLDALKDLSTLGQDPSNLCTVGYFFHSSKYPSVNSRMEKVWDLQNSFEKLYVNQIGKSSVNRRFYGVCEGQVSLEAALEYELTRDDLALHFMRVLIERLEIDFSSEHLKRLYPLHRVARLARIDIFKFLIEVAKADVNAVNAEKQTVLDALISCLTPMDYDAENHQMFSRICLILIYLMANGMKVEFEKLNARGKCFINYLKNQGSLNELVEALGGRKQTEQPLLFILAKYPYADGQITNILRLYATNFVNPFLKANDRSDFDGQLHYREVDVVEMLRSRLRMAESQVVRDMPLIQAMRDNRDLFRGIQRDMQKKNALLVLCAQQYAPDSAFFSLPAEMAVKVARHVKDGFEFRKPALK